MKYLIIIAFNLIFSTKSYSDNTDMYKNNNYGMSVYKKANCMGCHSWHGKGGGGYGGGTSLRKTSLSLTEINYVIKCGIIGTGMPYFGKNAAKNDECHKVGKMIYQLLKKDIKPRDIVSRESIENAVKLIIILGGSTNAVLHLIAIAHCIGVDLDLDDFTRIGKVTPVLADIKPFGDHFMSQLNEIGGITPMMKTMLDNNLLHGDCMTITGKTLEENLKEVNTSKNRYN